MSTKKRAAIAAAISGTAGSAAGLAAFHYNKDLVESTRFGALVSGAVGNLLHQAFRLTPDDTDGTPDVTANSSDSAGASGDTEPDITNAPDTHSDTANTGETTDAPGSAASGTADATAADSNAVDSADGAGAADRKHPRHRKLERGARRRVERHQRHERDEREENGRGAS